MADPAVDIVEASKQKDATRPEMPKLLRSMSNSMNKSLNKTRDNLKKAFTPRGGRGMSRTPSDAATAEPKAMEQQAAEKPSNGPAPPPTSVKATVKASSEGGPVEIKLEPVPDAAAPKHLPDPIAPAMPPSAPDALVQAVNPAANPVPSAPPMPHAQAHPAPALAAALPSSAIDSKGAPKIPVDDDDAEPEEPALAGSEPPQVRVIINAQPAITKADNAALAKDQPVKLHVAPVNKRTGKKGRKAAVSLLLLGAAGAIALAVTGKISR